MSSYNIIVNIVQGINLEFDSEDDLRYVNTELILLCYMLYVMLLYSQEYSGDGSANSNSGSDDDGNNSDDGSGSGYTSDTL